MTEPRICRACQERPLTPGGIRARHYVCNTCRNSQPNMRAARARYQRSNKGRIVSRARNVRSNPRRIFVGDSYHSKAATAEQAQRINTHIKGRLHAFKSGLKEREKTQGAAAS